MWRSIKDENSVKLSESFYQRTDVVGISKELLGKYLVTNFDGHYTAGRIVETEAYRAPDDKACHAHLNRFTARTRVMFEPGGVAYIYLCYGIHHLFNVVTATEGMAHAILIRAIEPVDGIGIMQQRRGMNHQKPQLTAGPGVMSKALGIEKTYTGASLLASESPIWIEDRGDVVPETDIMSGPRIGIDYAEECKDWPWRFWIRGNKWVSK
jgi:DNA-3-methyladenine glycosylase